MFELFKTHPSATLPAHQTSERHEKILQFDRRIKWYEFFRSVVKLCYSLVNRQSHLILINADGMKSLNQLEFCTVFK